MTCFHYEFTEASIVSVILEEEGERAGTAGLFLPKI